MQYNRLRYLVLQFGVFITQDPIGYQTGMNVFSYVNNGPIHFTDPSGEACVVPSGITHVTGRGFFKNVHIGNYDQSEDFRKWVLVGSDFHAKWEFDSYAFINNDGCCCCDKIGFIQVGKFSDVWYMWKGDWFKRKNFIDKAIPYPNSPPTNTNNPCLIPNPRSEMIDMNDSPVFGARSIGGAYGWILKSGKLDLTLCAVCVKGKEGIIKKGTKSGIVVYGCIEWGHEFIYSSKWNTWSVHRYINGAGLSKAIFGNLSDKIDAFNPKDMPPNEMWIDGYTNGKIS